jgi:hypothetical protein
MYTIDVACKFIESPREGEFKRGLKKQMMFIAYMKRHHACCCIFLETSMVALANARASAVG